MKKIGQLLSDIYTNYGIFPLITVMILIIIGVALLLLYKNPKILKRISERVEKRSYRVNRNKLQNHPLFEKKEEYLYRLKKLRFPGEYFKSVIIRLFISKDIKLNSNVMYDFINLENMNLNPMELKFAMYEAIDKVVKTFDDLIKLEIRNLIEMHVSFYRKDYTEEELNKFTEKLYKQVMYSENGWIEKRDIRLNDVKAYIKDIASNDIYNNNYERVHRLLDVMNFMIDSLISDSLRTFTYFNGTIEKMFDCFTKGCQENKF